MKRLREIEPSKQHLERSKKNQGLTLASDKEGLKRVASAICTMFEAMKVYGKDAESVESSVRLFKFALAEYTTEQILKGMADYTRFKSDFPTPSDIVGFIERGGRPAPNKSIYISFCKKEPVERTEEEWEYIRFYEKFHEYC